jgi:hypothetical protein
MVRSKTTAKSTGFTFLELKNVMALTGMFSLVTYVSLKLSLNAMQKEQMAATDLQEFRVGHTIIEGSGPIR